MSNILNDILDIHENDSINDANQTCITELPDVNDPLFTRNFIKNTSNYDSFDQMINFDTIEISKKIYEIIETFFKSNTIIININNSEHFDTLLNKYFSELVKHFIQIDFKKKEKFENVFSYIFIEFCDYIDCDYNKSFLALHEKFQNIIKRDLMKIIKPENFKRIEYRVKEKSKNDINNHKNVYFKALI